jgi:NADH-quinone oxidoreductase subunit F
MNQNSKEKLNEVFSSIKMEAERRFKEIKKNNSQNIFIGMATCGLASGAMEVKAAFEEALTERKINAHIIPVGCLGHCYAEPLVIIENPGFPPILYHNVTPGKAKLLVKAFLEEGDPVFEHILGAMEEDELIPSVMEFPRFNQEKRLVMANSGLIDPEDIHQYIAKGGYSALVKALTLEPEKIINEIQESGLRGRGGAGFLTGTKWQFVRNAKEKDKIIICNADEGDPGAYMDRTILESNPHQVIEGIAVSAYTVGAKRAIVYVRAEYPLAVKMTKKAIERANEIGLLGKRILGTNFDLGIEVFQGSGAFVCGEETALIQSIEGNRGMPQHRPPYPAQSGLWGKPTIINNVKTFGSIPSILENGSNWYREIGTDESPGTAIFSIVGNTVHAGLVEIPMGVTLRSLIFDICGGIPDQKKFKAVQIGGPSGGCLPEDFLDTPIDFDSLTKAGAMMGSGGMVVMDEDTCMVDVARYFLDFTQKESCGKCTFCRIGTRHLLDILNRITIGEGREGDIELLKDLGADIKEGSLCGLGKTAPNPILTTIRYFRDEYEEHINKKRCPAMMCRALIAYYIDLDKCAVGCDACVGSCPTEAIFTTSNRKKGVDQTLCIKCGECITACPPEYNAVRKVSPPELAPKIERPKEKEKDN